MVVVTIKSAESAKIEAEMNRARIDKELAEQKYKLEKEVENFTEKLIKWVNDEILFAIKMGKHYYSKEIYSYNWQYKDAPNFDKSIKLLCQALEKAGYQADYSYYSSSWQYRSKKICLFSVDW